MSQLRLPSPARRVLQPDQITKMKPGEKFLRGEASCNPPDQSFCHDVFRSMCLHDLMFYAEHGYHAKDPVTCIHHRKRMYAGTTRWYCLDCGSTL